MRAWRCENEDQPTVKAMREGDLSTNVAVNAAEAALRTLTAGLRNLFFKP